MLCRLRLESKKLHFFIIQSGSRRQEVKKFFTLIKLSKMEKNEAPKIIGIGETKMDTEPVPDIKPNEVLVKMSRVGICGSDLSMIFKGGLGDYKVNPPSGIGHEGCGVIYKLGADVKHLKVGDRVAIEHGEPCRNCDFCKSGKINSCAGACFYSKAGPIPTHGMLARFFKQRGDLCYKLPDNVSLEEGALTEPLAVAIHICKRANVEIGSSVLICGAGPIGLLCLITAKSMGAANILLTDIKEARLKTAKNLGATHTLLVGKETPEVLAEKVAQTMGCMPEITLECSGADDSLRMGIFATRASGKFVLASIGNAEVKLPIVNAAVREVDIIGIFRFYDYFPTALNMMSRGVVDVKPLITHRFKFEEFKKAFEMFKNGTDGAIKCVISCD